ncbi:MAG: peptidoglycan editing factor PgeF [Lachnospiraceae bacterium]|nr:peptidoglycan editing factor PgeF [Lachnospiraceae bacterium]
MIKNLNNISYIDNYDNVPVIRFIPFDRFEWLNCGFSTRIGGVSEGCHESLNLGFERGDKRENVEENFRRFALSAGFDENKICFPAQWHTNNIRIASSESCGYLTADPQEVSAEEKIKNAIDGQITDEKDIVLISYGADCTPVYLADPTHHAIGLVHSGWKGTLNSISRDALNLMNLQYGTKPEDVVAVIGPSISSDNYEVGIDVAEHFINKHHIEVSEKSSIVRFGKKSPEQKYQLDLWEANRQNLLDAGVSAENIFISGLCTFKEDALFYSHRRTGNARGVMAGFMTIIH